MKRQNGLTDLRVCGPCHGGDGCVRQHGRGREEGRGDRGRRRQAGQREGRRSDGRCGARRVRRDQAAGEAVAEGTADATDDAAAASSAAATTTSVKSALMADKSVDATRIDVDSDGTTKVVTLRGSVPSEAQRASAERIARARQRATRS